MTEPVTPFAKDYAEPQMKTQTEKPLEDEAAVLRHKLEKFRNSPRRWSYWIAAFTAAHGLLLATSQDIVLLAGLISPYQSTGATWHFVAAGVIAMLANYEPEAGIGPGIALIVYTVDLLWPWHLGLWGAVTLHVVVFAFVAIGWNGARLLEQRILAMDTHGGPDRAP